MSVSVGLSVVEGKTGNINASLSATVNISGGAIIIVRNTVRTNQRERKGNGEAEVVGRKEMK